MFLKLDIALSYNSFIDWNAPCDGQFANMYCPVEMNEYNGFPEGKSPTKQ